MRQAQRPARTCKKPNYHPYCRSLAAKAKGAIRDDRTRAIESTLTLFFIGIEVDGGGVDAEANAGRRRAVVENMAEMCVAAAAENLSARHTVRRVAMHLDIV